MNRLAPGETSVRTEAAVKIHSTGMKVVPVDDGRAVREIRVVVKFNSAVMAPIEIPMVPSPTEAAEEPDAESKPEADARAIEIESRIRIPAGKHRQRSAVHDPRIILRHVNDVRLCGLDHDRLPFGFYILLGSTVQVAGLFGALPHALDGLRDILLLV